MRVCFDIDNLRSCSISRQKIGRRRKSKPEHFHILVIVIDWKEN